MVIIEGFACGLPAIVTDCIGPKSVVRHGEDGLVIKQGDAAGLARAIGALQWDSELTARMSRAARMRAVEEFSLQAVAESWRECLESATHGPQGTTTGVE